MVPSDPQVDKTLLVKNWLEGNTSGRWILILDNADDIDLLYGGQDTLSRLANYFPRSSNGSILLTTRNKKVGIHFTTSRNVLSIPALTIKESVCLLTARLADDACNEHKNSQLATVLDNVPLALVQAAAYISAQSCSVSKYLELYSQSDSVKAQLLSKDFEDDIRDNTIRNPVSATFAISFEQIKNSHSKAADILSIISMLDSQAIPTSLIPFDEDPVLFTEALGTLKAFSLIMTTSQEGQQDELFDLHRLVRLATRNWLWLSHELESWKIKALLTISERFPPAFHENREVCRAYLPHALVLLSPDQIMEERVVQAALEYKVSWYLTVKGDYIKAKPIALSSLVLLEKALGQEHPDILTSISNLASVLYSQGKYEEAEAMNRQALQLYEKALGLEHPDTLTSVYCLSYFLQGQGQYHESSVLYQRACAGYQNTLGSDHPTTLACLDHYNSLLESMET